MAHPDVTAHAGGVLLGSLGAAEVLNLLAQGLQGGVHLHVTVTHHVGVVRAVATVGIWGLLLQRLADKHVESASGGSRGSGGAGSTRATLG